MPGCRNKIPVPPWVWLSCCICFPSVQHLQTRMTQELTTDTFSAAKLQPLGRAFLVEMREACSHSPTTLSEIITWSIWPIQASSQQRFSGSHGRVAATLFWDLQALGSPSFASYRLGDSESRIWRLVNILSQARFLLTFTQKGRASWVSAHYHQPSQVTGPVSLTSQPNLYVACPLCSDINSVHPTLGHFSEHHIRFPQSNESKTTGTFHRTPIFPNYNDKTTTRVHLYRVF